MSEEFIRSEILFGTKNIEKLKKSKIAVFGIGGVGSYVVEALSRSSIGSLVLIDDDIISESNINRQLIALYSTIGKYKVDVSESRALDINPKINIKTYKLHYPSNKYKNIICECDYVIDAIDTISSKITLVKECQNKNIPIISCMGTGNKINPNLFQISDIYKTHTCPLCKVMRKELKNQGITNLKVLFSTEQPKKNIYINNFEKSINSYKKRQLIGSVSFVPSVAGLIIVSEVIKDILF